MLITYAQLLELLNRLLATNITGEITALDIRTVLMQMGLYTQQTEALIEAVRIIANEAKDAGATNATAIETLMTNLSAVKTTADDNEAENRSIRDELVLIRQEIMGGDNHPTPQTPEQLAAQAAQRDGNTAYNTAQTGRNTAFTNAIAELERIQGLHDTRITTAQTTADGAATAAGTAQSRADTAVMNDGTTRGLLSNLETQKVDPAIQRITNLENIPPGDSLTPTQRQNIEAIPGLVEDIGTVGATPDLDTGLKGDVKNLQADTNRQDEATAEARRLAQEALDREIVSSIDASDFLVRSGVTAAQTPGITYRGSGDQEFANANPGVVFQRATGQFMIPAVNLEGVPSGSPFRWSGAYLNAGKTGRQSGFDPILYYVIEQGVNRIVGSGAVDSTDNLARNWVALDNIESPSELRTDHLVTGETFIVRWIAIYSGVDATLAPSLSGGIVSFTGEFEPAIEGIVHDVTDARFNSIEATATTLEGTVAAEAVEGANTKRVADSNSVLINGVRTRLALPQYQAIEEATVVESATETIDATTLNNTLGTGGQPFARNFDDPIGTATQFITRITHANQVLDYGAGRVADVFNGHIRIFRLVPERDSETNTETRYITTPSGLGTRTRPAVLEFGVAPSGSNVKQAADTELFLDTGVPPSVLPGGTTISNVSMAFAVRTNGNWNGIANTLQFAIRSGETRFFAVPAPIVDVLFRATGLADGRIHCEALHRNGVGNANDLVTNAAAIRFDAAYVETVVTPAVARGQTTEDGGVFTGNNLIAIDVGQAGDSDTLTASIVTPTATYNTGYFLREAHRTGFRTENAGFDVLVSDNNTALTPAVMAQLDGTDQYLGLFARTNHHDDALQFAHGVVVPTSDGTESYNVGDQIKMILAIPRGTGITLAQARGEAQDVVNNSPAIQANTAKPDSDEVKTIAETAIADGLSDGGSIDTAIQNSGGSGTTPTEKSEIAKIPGLASDILANANTSSENQRSIAANSDKITVLENNTLVQADFQDQDIRLGEFDFSGTPLVQGANFNHGPQFGAFIDMAELLKSVTLPQGTITPQGLALHPRVIITPLNMGDAPLPDNLEVGIEYNDNTSSASSAYGYNTIKDYDVITNNTFGVQHFGAGDQAYFAVSGLDRNIDYAVKMVFDVELNSEFYGSYTLPLANNVKSLATQVPLLSDRIDNLPTIATDEQIRNAIDGSPEANPFSLFNKFSTDGDFQVSESFNDEVAMAHDFSKDVNDANDRRLVVNILKENTALTAKVRPNIPFTLKNEGIIRYTNNNNGAKFIRVTREVTYYPGETFAFTISNSEVIRSTSTDSGDFDLNIFNREVVLTQTTIDRFPDTDNTPVSMRIYFEISTTNDFSVLQYSNNITNALTFEFIDLGVIFSQHRSIIGAKGEKGDPATAGARAEDIQQAMSAPVTSSQTYTVDGLFGEEYPLDITPPPMATQGGTLVGSITLTKDGTPITGIAYHALYTDGPGTIFASTGFFTPTVDGTSYSIELPDVGILARPFQFRIRATGATRGDRVTFAFNGELRVGEKGVLVDGAIQLIERFASASISADVIEQAVIAAMTVTEPAYTTPVEVIHISTGLPLVDTPITFNPPLPIGRASYTMGISFRVLSSTGLELGIYYVGSEQQIQGQTQYFAGNYNLSFVVDPTRQIFFRARRLGFANLNINYSFTMTVPAGDGVQGPITTRILDIIRHSDGDALAAVQTMTRLV